MDYCARTGITAAAGVLVKGFAIAFPPANLDWVDIQKRWCAGETSSSIARSLPPNDQGKRPISRQAIDERAQRGGWIRGVDPDKIAQARELPACKALQAVADARLQQPDIKVPRAVAVMRGWGKKTPETIASILSDIELGISEAKSAQHAGIADTTWLRWKADDADLMALVEQARAQFLRKNLNRIDRAAEKTDWKAAMTLIERSPNTREDFKSPEAAGKAGVTIQVVLNIPRAETQPGDEAIVIEGLTQ